MIIFLLVFYIVVSFDASLIIYNCLLLLIKKKIIIRIENNLFVVRKKKIIIEIEINQVHSVKLKQREVMNV